MQISLHVLVRDGLGGGVLAVPLTPDMGIDDLQRILQPQKIWGELREYESFLAWQEQTLGKK